MDNSKKAKAEMPNVSRLRQRAQEFIEKQPPALDIAVKTLFGTVQGGALGYAMGLFMKSSIQTAKTAGTAQATVNPMAAQLQASGGVWGQTRSLAALCGVSAGLSAALKKVRGKEDIWTQ